MNREHRAIAALYAAGIVAAGATVAMASLSGRPADHFTRDPLAVVEEDFYVGFLSNLGAMVWSAAAAIAWLIAIMIASRGSPKRTAAMLICMALILTMLGMDDLFMLHEELLQRHLGVSERITLLVYAAIVAVFTAGFFDELRRTPWRLVIPVAVLFTASIVVDQFTGHGFGWRPVIEDVLKFMGVVGLLAYVGCIAGRFLQVRSAPAHE